MGFSVGASAVWALSGQSDLLPGSRAFCFYGSQIRHYAAVVPMIEIELFFPETEPHFDVLDLMRRLSVRSGVVCHRTSYRHGFMNRLSEHFDPAAYSFYLQVLKEKIL
jgi:dienelactone hydrolase